MPRVTFIHPDLGIGGAERLIVDAALGLKAKGHSISIVTTHHDPNRCFDETANGDLPVIIVGNWIPRSVFNRFYALMAYIRMIYAAIYVMFSDLNPDVIICDLVSVAVPVLKFRFSNVIFYCHYPDQLLSRQEGLLKKIYRIPLDWLEEVSIGKASRVFVNSQFTASVFRETFKRITVSPDILYPSLNTRFFDSINTISLPAPVKEKVKEDDIIYLSINRYERKKNLQLALLAFHKLKSLISENEWEHVKLVIAGGYDTRVWENTEHYEELIQITEKLELSNKVIFLKSPSDVEKVSLLRSCNCLIYTPSNEHFGIVPVEAMYLKKPVIAVNTGGPTETIASGSTGYLCDSNEDAFAEAMSKFISNKKLTDVLGEAGRRRVCELFSFEEFANKLDQAVLNLVNKKDD